MLVADEPTTALDVTIQAQILDLLRELQAEIGMSIWFITHDLGVVAELAHDVAVMYAAKVVERSRVEDLFAKPRHPYTRGLFKSLAPRLAAAPRGSKRSRASCPNPLDFPSGCKFHPRCPHADRGLREGRADAREIEPGHGSRASAVEQGEI